MNVDDIIKQLTREEKAALVAGVDLYAYGLNNPVMYVDPTGHSPEWYDIAAWIGGGLFAAATIVLTAGLAGAVIGGVVGGIIYGAAIGTIALGTVGAGVGAVGGTAAYSVTGLTNASFWTGLGPSGEIIAGQAANSQGLITLGQTFGGKVAQFMTNRFG